MNPKYNEYMMPLLKLMSNNKVFPKRDLYSAMVHEFRLSDVDLQERIPSGTQLTYTNRIGWALTYLKKAGLIISPSRAHFKITSRGLDLIETKIDSIDKDFLMRYDEFKDFKNITNIEDSSNDTQQSSKDDISPEELIGRYHQEIKSMLINDLLDEILQSSPRFFERLVLDLLESMGYGEAEGTPYVNDQGIDGIIKSDALGLERIYVQAKRYSKGNVVGSPELNKFVGAIAGKRGAKGVFITTSTFTQNATQYANSISDRVVLIDGNQLGKLMFDYNIGLQTSQTYSIKKIDVDYFDE